MLQHLPTSNHSHSQKKTNKTTISGLHAVLLAQTDRGTTRDRTGDFLTTASALISLCDSGSDESILLLPSLFDVVLYRSAASSPTSVQGL